MHVCQASRAATLVTVLWLCACTTAPQRDHAAQRDPPVSCGSDAAAAAGQEPAQQAFLRSRLIVLDLVNALIQLPGVEPARTTLDADVPRSQFDRLLLERLQQYGYALRWEAHGGGRRLSYSVHSESPVDFEAGILRGRYTFQLTVGDVSIRRAYQVSEFGVAPASSLFVKGADASGLILNDAVFAISGSAEVCSSLPAGSI